MASSVVVILVLAFVSVTNCDYSCVDDKKVDIFGTRLECPPGQKCNVNNINGEPCIDEDKTCQRFSCPGNDKTSNEVAVEVIDGTKSQLLCPEPLVCNRDNDKCKGEVCVKPKCPEQVWKCSADGTGFTLLGGTVKYPCDTGSTCNTKNVYPCQPCIITSTGQGISLRSLLSKY